jgi:hypothetical protein
MKIVLGHQKYEIFLNWWTLELAIFYYSPYLPPNFTIAKLVALNPFVPILYIFFSTKVGRSITIERVKKKKRLRTDTKKIED